MLSVGSGLQLQVEKWHLEFCLSYRYRYRYDSKQAISTGNFVPPRLVKYCKGKEKDYFERLLFEVCLIVYLFERIRSSAQPSNFCFGSTKKRKEIKTLFTLLHKGCLKSLVGTDRYYNKYRYISYIPVVFYCMCTDC